MSRLCCLLLLVGSFGVVTVQAWLGVSRSSSFRSSSFVERYPTGLFASKEQQPRAIVDTDSTVDRPEEEITSHSINVSFEGRSCSIDIEDGETVLAALERNQVPHRLAMPEVPSDCRRGNCMTCVGQHRNSSNRKALAHNNDKDNGLTTSAAQELQRQGYVLTCSSKVVGEGLSLELGQSHHAWKDIYVNRLSNDSAKQVAREAVAKAIRKNDENHVERWAEETKELLKRTPSEEEP